MKNTSRTPLVHVPGALRQMLWLQLISVFRRLSASVSSPRKLVLSALAILLAVFWLGNAVASILFREPYAFETFRRGILASLMAYFVWPIIKAACRRPEDAIEWSASERELICAGPFTRQELLSYRACVILSSTLLKALCVTVLLMTDLHTFWLGALGILLVLVFLDFARMATEIAFWGVSQRGYITIRISVLAGLAAVIAVCVAWTLKAPAPDSTYGPAAFSLILRFVFGDNYSFP